MPQSRPLLSVINAVWSKKLRSLDTNIALRLMLHDSPQQMDKIIALIDGSKSGSLAMADAVFIECVWILTAKMYGLDRELIGKLLLQVAGIPQINCNRAMLERAVPLYVNNPNISFVDACLAVYAELNDATPLLTFDKKLVRALPST
jgi:predicted nucleic-acid-binding protein